MLRSKPQRWIPELRFGYPPLRNFPKSFWEKLGIFLESLGGQGGDKPSPNADFSRFSLIFADSRPFLENKAFGKRRFSQKTIDFRRKPLIFAGNRRKPQIGVCPLRFVPLSAALGGSQRQLWIKTRLLYVGLFAQEGDP